MARSGVAGQHADADHLVSAHADPFTPEPLMDAELCYRTAVELTSPVRGGELSARELLAAHVAKIEITNPLVNAMWT